MLVGLGTKGGDDGREESCLHVTYSLVRTADYRICIPKNLRTHENEQRVDVIRIVVHLSFVIREHHVLNPTPSFEIRIGKLLFKQDSWSFTLGQQRK